MAEFKINRTQSSYAMADYYGFSAEDKLAVLNAGAAVLQEALTNKILTTFKPHTYDLANSIKIWTKNNKAGELVVVVGPKGNHSRATAPGRRRRSRATTVEGQKYHKHNRTDNSTYSGTNAEILYVLNYGSARIKKPYHVIDIAVEESDAAVVNAMDDEFNAIVERLISTI